MQIGLEDRAESTATLTGGGAEAELVDRGAAAVLRASGLQDSTRGVAGEKNKGSEGSKIPRRRANRGELRVHLRRRFWQNLTALVLLSWLGRWLQRRWDPEGTPWRIKKRWVGLGMRVTQ